MTIAAVAVSVSVVNIACFMASELEVDEWLCLVRGEENNQEDDGGVDETV
jgi:hypothetical protein